MEERGGWALGGWDRAVGAGQRAGRWRRARGFQRGACGRHSRGKGNWQLCTAGSVKAHAPVLGRVCRACVDMRGRGHWEAVN